MSGNIAKDLVDIVKKKDFNTLWLILCFVIVGHQIKSYNGNINHQFEQTTKTFQSIQHILDKIDKRLDDHSEHIARINEIILQQDNKIETSYKLYNSNVQKTMESYREDQRKYHELMIRHFKECNCSK